MRGGRIRQRGAVIVESQRRLDTLAARVVLEAADQRIGELEIVDSLLRALGSRLNPHQLDRADALVRQFILKQGRHAGK